VQLPTFIALAQVRPNKQGLHTMKIQELYHRLLWRSATQALGHMHGVRSSSARLQAFFDVKFCRR